MTNNNSMIFVIYAHHSQEKSDVMYACNLFCHYLFRLRFFFSLSVKSISMENRLHNLIETIAWAPNQRSESYADEDDVMIYWPKRCV